MLEEPKNPRLQALVEAYDKELADLVNENKRLRSELNLDTDEPVDWASDDEHDSNAEVDLPVRANTMPDIGRSTSGDVHQVRQSYSTFDHRNIPKSGKNAIKLNYTVLPKFLSSVLDQASEAQHKATLLQELRRFSEHQTIDLSAVQKRPTCYELFIHFLEQLRLPMSPNAEIRLVWDILGLMFIIYDLFAIPMQAFNPPEDGFTEGMGWTTLIFWSFDVVMSNIVGYFDGPHLVMQPWKITMRYLKSWFILDCVVVGPDWFTRLAGDSGDSDAIANAGRILRSARAIRVIRLLRLLKLQKLLSKIYDFIDSEYMFIIADMIRLISFIIVLNHVIACLWYLVGYTGYEAGERNWLEDTGKTKVIDGTLAWKYLTALHWSLTQFTPAGMDVYAMNVPERIMSIVVLMFAIITFSSILASVSGSMTALRNLQGDTKKQFWLLRRYLRTTKVRPTSRVRIIKYLEHLTMTQAKTVKMHDVVLLPKLSGPLTDLLAYELKKNLVVGHPFLQYVDNNMQSVLVKLCSHSLREAHLAAEDSVFRMGDVGENCYFLKSGELIYLGPTGDKVEGFDHGSWFAEACLWTVWNHKGLLHVAAPTETVVLSPDAWANVMRINQCPYELCRRYAFSFVSRLNAIGGDVPVTDLPWDSQSIRNMVLESAESSGVAEMFR